MPITNIEGEAKTKLRYFRMKIGRSNKLNGDGQAVGPGQIYRILAYDRRMDEYCFIPLKERREGFIADLLGSGMKIMRYMPETAYVFHEDTTFPTFQATELGEVQKWAKANCIEHREIPDWWLVEDGSQVGEVINNKVPEIKITKVYSTSNPDDDDSDEEWCYDYDCRYKPKKNRNLDYHI